ncbi:MAG: TIGR04283 family arsenosugar biosynthesis glycosyltransferase [Gammaproteobacteria bacterium]|nr:TIGR04283 family arsenosugar biosynthesis glycosyltransferase [Gammaproteobacteria bacterium]MDH5694636.1 TIGR04283 family arsenosugar biosynthesis glycosyltransferase [Gammaproteobacteria bacterium]
MKLSIIIPVLNEANTIRETLFSLQALRREGHQLLVVDGGSEDDTVAYASPLCDELLSGTKGRANQMNLGAQKARHDVFLFLHADTQLPENAVANIQSGLQSSSKVWGRFDVRLSGSHFMFRVIEKMMNWRSCLTAVATGDQAIFVKRDVFEQISGFEPLPLMEDIALSKSLRKKTRPVCIHETVTTSSRRWEAFGIWKTIFLMWRLRLAYFLGTSPEKLSHRYRFGNK